MFHIVMTKNCKSGTVLQFWHLKTNGLLLVTGRPSQHRGASKPAAWTQFVYWKIWAVWAEWCQSCYSLYFNRYNSKSSLYFANECQNHRQRTLNRRGIFIKWILKPLCQKNLYFLYGRTNSCAKFANETYMKSNYHYSVKQQLTLV